MMLESKLKRRSALFEAALLTIASAVAFVSVAKADSTTLRGAHIYPATYVQSGVIYEKWAEEISAESDGEIKVNIVHGGALLGVKDHVDGIASGLVDTVSFYPIYFPGEFRVEGALTNITDVWSAETASLQSIGAIHAQLHSEFEVFQQEYAKRNMRMLVPLPVDPYVVACAEPVKDLADLKGRKMRSFGRYFPILQEHMGVEPISVPSSEAYGALSSGLIDCIYTTPSFIYSNKFHEVAPYVFIPGTEQARPQALCTAVIAMNSNSYDKLSDAHKKIVDDVSERMIVVAGEMMTTVYNDSLAQLEEATGNKIVHMTEADFADWRSNTPNLLDQAAEDLEKEGYPGAEIITRYKELVANYTN